MFTATDIYHSIPVAFSFQNYWKRRSPLYYSNWMRCTRFQAGSQKMKAKTRRQNKKWKMNWVLRNISCKI